MKRLRYFVAIALLVTLLIPTNLSAQTDRADVLVQISYGFTVSDATDYAYPLSHTLTDEYGVYSQDLGTYMSSGTVWVEAYCEGGDQNGHTYTFRVAARDSAGNEASTQAVSTILHNQ